MCVELLNYIDYDIFIVTNMWVFCVLAIRCDLDYLMVKQLQLVMGAEPKPSRSRESRFFFQIPAGFSAIGRLRSRPAFCPAWPARLTINQLRGHHF